MIIAYMRIEKKTLFAKIFFFFYQDFLPSLVEIALKNVEDYYMYYYFFICCVGIISP